MTFDGDPIKYWQFIRVFETVVDKESISHTAKLTRLVQYCTGKARRVIQCCMVYEPSVGYAKARQILRERFGNEYAIAEAWITKIAKRPNIKPNDGYSLQELADELLTCRETLAAMDKLSELNNQRSLVQIVEKLPSYLQDRWLTEVYRIKTKGSRTPNVEDLVEFVCLAAAQANDAVFGKLKRSDKSDNQTHQRESSKGKSIKSPKQTTSFAIKTDPPKETSKSTPGGATVALPKTCIYCGASHYLLSCDGFRGLKTS